MLSTLSILCIFTEIFACGVLFIGVFAFLKKFWDQRISKDLALSFVMLTFSIYIGLTIASQLLFNLGTTVSVLMMIQKAIAWDLIIGSLFVLIFINEKYKIKFFIYFLWLYSAAAITMFFRIASSSVDLIYRPEVLEPVVSFSTPTPVRSIWFLSWLVLLCFSIFFFVRQKGSERIIQLYDTFAAFMFFSSYLSTIAYTGSQNSYFLLISWVLILLGAISISIGEILPPNSPLAYNPVSFFRSRILFKMILVIVLLIVFLFQITTLATLTLSKQALRNSIFSSYTEAAQSLAQKIQSMKTLNQKELEQFVSERRIGRSGILYIVDKTGHLLAHPDKTYTATKADLSKFEPVRKALSGYSGSGQFPPDAFGDLKAGAYAPIKNIGGAVIVEEPLADAYFELRQLETNSLLLMIAGIILTVLTGLFLAEHIESPIKKLMSGTESISKGNLNLKIEVESIDEMGSLAQSFNKMTHDLKESQERLILSEKLASLGTMAAGMAHEIKNPLVSLRTFSQLLQQKWNDPEFRAKFSQIVPTEIERINKIAESLLKFGRPMKAEMGNINVNAILEEILLLFESESRKNGIRVSTKLANLPEITGDTQQLSQAFVNIILNGIQSMEKGGELTVKTDVGEVIQIDDESEAAQKETGKPIKVIFIEISDTGGGISPENLKSLFDPFFTTKVKGTGMGLPITLRIIEDHKGSIKVKSEVGKGTSFLITLPQ